MLIPKFVMLVKVEYHFQIGFSNIYQQWPDPVWFVLLELNQN
jgi:hypothetical protein